MIVIDLEPLQIGTDYIYPFKVADKTGKALDVSEWTLSFMLKKRLTDEDADAVLEKTNGQGLSVSGNFDENPLLNEQVISVIFQDADSDGQRAIDYEYELKRMDPGFEGIIAKGKLPFVQSVHRT